MRILFSSTHGHGHVFPLVPLALACQAAGHEVLWAGHPDACTLVSQAGLHAAPAGLRGQRFAEVIGDLRRRAGQLPPPERAAFMFPNMFGAALTPAMTTDLLSLARDWQPDLLVHEQAELASPLVGAVLGVPSVMQSFGGAIPPEFVVTAGELLGPLWQQHGQQLPPYAGCFGAPFLDICPPSVRPVPLDHIAVVRQLRPVSYTGPPSTLPIEPSDNRPLIYLTLGTIPTAGPALLTALTAIAALPVRILATVGPDGDPSALALPSDNVTVVGYVSQADLLPNCAVVVSHAGSGTFLGALSNGLPQLCLPQAADQFRNASACAAAGAGLALHPDQASTEAIRDAVSALLTDGRFRAAAAGIRAEIQAMPAPATVVEYLETLT
ncbi:MAG: glycosyltransferase [Jatrophihabitantaceae bacterium]